jgi:hypothetical protein
MENAIRIFSGFWANLIKLSQIEVYGAQILKPWLEQCAGDEK